MKHCRYRSRSERPSTETKEKNFISGLIIRNDETVGVGNVVKESIAIDESPKHRQFLFQPCRPPRLRHGTDAGIIISQLSRMPACHFVRANDIRVISVELIVRSIAAQNKILWH